MTEISLTNVTKTFGFKNILNGLNIEIKTGDRISIIGENGCGKTTILTRTPAACAWYAPRKRWWWRRPSEAICI